MSRTRFADPLAVHHPGRIERIAVKRKFGNEEHRAVDTEFETVKAGHVVLETENGVRIRVQLQVTKIFVAVDNHGNIIRGPTGEPLVNCDLVPTVRAEISDTVATPA